MVFKNQIEKYLAIKIKINPMVKEQAIVILIAVLKSDFNFTVIAVKF